jgi:aminoglycoside phosphotransferase (APT) family kinase protein
MVERYALRAGLDDVPPLHWYFAFNLFRLASIVQGIHARARTGSASDPEALAKGARVEPLAEAALAQLDLHDT